MTGAIKRAGVFATGTTTDAVISLHGGTESLDGAGIWLYGKDNTNAGKFLLRSADANGNVDLVGYPNGGLSWNGKNIVRSVNGTSADAAGNVAITSVASATTATKATQDGNGKVIADTYAVDTNVVHKSGNETINGTKLFAGVLDFSNSSAGTGYRGFLYKLSSGQLSLGIRTSDNSKFQSHLNFATDGNVAITASDGTNSKSLLMKHDGTLTWDGKNVLCSSAVSSTELGYLDGVTSAIQTQLNNKAALASPTFTGTPKAPTAASSTNSTQIATTAFVKSVLSSSGNGLATFSKAQNGYYKFSNGLIIQWGVATGTADNRTVTLPTAFTSTNYMVSAMPFTSGVTESFYSISVDSGRTTTSMVLRAAGTAKNAMWCWIAIGY